MMIIDNPSIGNYEELGDLYLDDGKFVKARECFDKVLAREESIDPLYRRALSAIALNDYSAAAADLQKVVDSIPSTTISERPACSRTSSGSSANATRRARCSRK